MLSDTSSIISEFILQKKPVVTFCNRMPGDHLINVTFDEDIEQAIEHALTRPASLMSAIDRYIADLHPYDDGRSSARVLVAVDDFLKNEIRLLNYIPEVNVIVPIPSSFSIRKIWSGNWGGIES